MNGQPGPEHGCRSLTDAVLVQTRMLSAQVHYRFSYMQTQPQKAYFIIFTLLAPRDWSPGVSKTEVLIAIEAERQPLGRKPGLGGVLQAYVPNGCRSPWRPEAGSASEPQPRPGHGEGRALPKTGDGEHFSVTTSYQGGRGPPWCQRAGTAFPGDSAWREGRDGDN